MRQERKLTMKKVKITAVRKACYPAEDADLEAVERFDAGQIRYNKY